MNPRSYVLDTSAVLTLVEEEAGADRVEQVITEEEATLPWLTLLEAYYISQQERGKAEADRRYALMKRLPATILWNVDEPITLTAARLKAVYRLSLGDAIIAAYAIQNESTLLHKDPELEALAGQVDLEALPYKRPVP